MRACQDRHCDREASGPPFILDAERVELAIDVCEPHRLALADEIDAVRRLHSENAYLRHEQALVDFG
jgi:hypothetical protein